MHLFNKHNCKQCSPDLCLVLFHFWEGLMVDLHSKQRKRPCEETQSGCITLLLKQHISMVIAEQLTITMFVNVFKSLSVLFSECSEISRLPGCEYIVKHREEKMCTFKRKVQIVGFTYIWQPKSLNLVSFVFFFSFFEIFWIYSFLNYILVPIFCQQYWTLLWVKTVFINVSVINVV